MQGIHVYKGVVLIALASMLTACATQGGGGYRSASYSSRLPQEIKTGGEKVVIVDPSVNAWGAYGRDGKLVKAGIATAGNSYCPDIGRPCRTHVGTFRTRS